MLLYKLLIITTTLVFFGSGIAFFLICYPLHPLPTDTGETPLYTTEEALHAIATFDQTEETLNPVCASKVFFHGQKTDRVIVLLHGYTNCPQQFATLGEQLFNEGYNVLIPRTPGHGYAENMTEALGHLSHKDLLAYLQQSIAIADALGEDITVVGLSGGGTLTLWASLFEERADRFVTIAPVAYPTGFAPWLRNAVVRYAAWTPNKFDWWNKELKDTRPSPPYAYHRYASKSMGEILHMTASIEQYLPKYSTGKPITFVINEGDPALRTTQMYWLRDRFIQYGMHVQTHTYPKEQQLPHDLIDPHNIKEHQERIYQDLINSIKNA